MQQGKNNRNDVSIRTRKPYAKPQIEMIKLIPGEAVLAEGCKASLTINAWKTSAPGCLDQGCVADGS